MLEPDFDTYKALIENQPNYFTLRKNLMQAEKDIEKNLGDFKSGVESSFFDDARKQLKE